MESRLCRIAVGSATVFLLAACSGSEKLAIPSAQSIESIYICQGYSNCDIGKFSLTDRPLIDGGLKAVSLHQTGWQTETQMAWSTGWFNFPTPMESIGFREKSGATPLVLWFGPGWMGAAVTDGPNRTRYFKKVTPNDVAELRQALRLTGRSSGPPSAAAERVR